MKDPINRTELIKILIEERNFHFSHPHEIIRKIIFSIGATITSIFIALFIEQKKVEDSQIFELLQDWTFFLPLIIISLGYIFILYGIKEHSSIHREQRKRITKAIEYLVTEKSESFSNDNFWNEHGLIQLRLNNKNYISNPTSLFAIEPDTREWWQFHDRKIELGSLIIILGFLGLILSLVL